MNPTPTVRTAFHLALMLGAIGLGLLAGFALRALAKPRVTPERMANVSASPASPAAAKAERLGPQFRAQDDDSPLTTQLARDMARSSGVTRWLYFLDALEKAGPTDFPRLYRLMQADEAAKKLVQARWIEVAPRHLFDLVVAGPNAAHGLPMNELAYALFDEWPKVDPDAAIAALNERGHIKGEERWRFTVAYSLMPTDVERSFRLMREWHADETGIGPRGITAVTKWTRENPLHAAEFLFGFPDSRTCHSAVETLGQEWARIDPSAALDFASRRSGEMANVLASQALKTWAAKNLPDAVDWLSRADEPIRRRFGPAFAEAWARHDAAGAVSWCEEHLTGSSLVQSVAGAMSGAAEKNAAAAAALVSEMNPSAARAEAALAVAQRWLPGLASGKRVDPEAVAWLAGLDAESVRRVMDRVTWGWATSDPRSMADFLTKANSADLSPHAYRIAAQELARHEPAEALQWAAGLRGEASLTAGGAAFREWQSSQPDAAWQWLGELSSTDPRRQPYFETTIRSVAYHPQAEAQLTAMSPAHRASARTVIEGMNLAEDRRAQLLKVLGR